MTTSTDVLIIGGGVIGLNCAYSLATAGFSVRLIERCEFGCEASWAGAGILAPAHEDAPAGALAKLHALSARLYPELSQALREETGRDNGYRRCGAIELALDAAEAAALSRRAARAQAAGAPWRPITAEETGALEPSLTPQFAGAFLAPEVAQLRNPWHLEALAAACRRRGVDLRINTPVAELLREKRRVTGARAASGEAFFAEKTLITAGLWSSEILEHLGAGLAMRAARGQILLFRAGRPPLARVVRSGAGFLVAREDGRVLAGDSQETAGAEKEATSAEIARLRALAIRLCPALEGARIERAWAGARPATPDGKPYIGELPGFENLYAATGHFRTGVTLAPATAQVIRELFAGEPLSVSLEEFHPNRTVRDTLPDTI